MAHRMTHTGALLLLLIAVAPALAQATLTDPTRPPTSVGESTIESGIDAGPVLQAVIIPRHGKPLAIIGGQQVMLGGMYGDSRVVRLTEREAVLVGPSGKELLLLTPEVKKTRVGIKDNSKTLGVKSAQVGSR